MYREKKNEGVGAKGVSVILQSINQFVLNILYCPLILFLFSF